MYLRDILLYFELLGLEDYKDDSRIEFHGFLEDPAWTEHKGQESKGGDKGAKAGVTDASQRVQRRNAATNAS